MTTPHPAPGALRGLRVVLVVIGAVQLVLGALFLTAPGRAATILGLEPAAPGWVSWLFAMMAARFLGYGVGMLAAARTPERHLLWINTMIAIQAADWLATLGYLASGDVTLGQVTSAAFLPVLFIGALFWWHPSRGSRTRLVHPGDSGGAARA